MKHLVAGALLAWAAAAQPKSELKVWMNGTGVAIHTESGNTVSPLSTSGSVVVGKGPAHRVVVDSQNKPLFAYDLELSRGERGTVVLRIQPVDPEYGKTASPAGIPTIAGARVFQALRPGDEVQVDIMYNPSTSEKLWDVLRVIAEPAPAPQPVKAAPGERFSFERVKLAIDGKTVVEERQSWMIGAGVMMRIPGRGEYYLALTPPAAYPFEASGWVDHNVLRFRSGNEQFEITGRRNLLEQSDYGTVWVYHLPETAPAKSSSVDFACADNIEWLMPKGGRK